MKQLVTFFLLPVFGFAAPDESWDKQRAMKSGTEVRVYKRSTTQPIVGKVDEVREDAIVLVVKDTQVSIAKDEIDRLDARPEQTSSRVRKETKTETKSPPPGPGTPVMGTSSGAPEGHSSTNFTFGGKPAFETVYRRPPVAQKKN